MIFGEEATIPDESVGELLPEFVDSFVLAEDTPLELLLPSEIPPVSAAFSDDDIPKGVLFLVGELTRGEKGMWRGWNGLTS